MIKNPPSSSGGVALELEFDAHWAKYTCVLISGFIEQSVKEIFLEHVSKQSSSRIANYIRTIWPNSKNMHCESLGNILSSFEPSWADEFASWVNDEERKKEINEIIRWRNNIAHGKESNTNNVTINSVKQKFRIACELIDYLENLTSANAG